MNTPMKRIADLALVRAVPDMILGMNSVPNGRMRGLLERLQRAVDKELARGPALADGQIKAIGEKMFAFGQVTGWERKEKNMLTIINMLLALHEKERLPDRISQILCNIHDHLERGGHAPAATYWSGARAAELWMEVRNG